MDYVVIVTSFPTIHARFRVTVAPVDASMGERRVGVSTVDFIHASFVVLYLPGSFFLLFLWMIPLYVPGVVRCQCLRGNVPMVFAFRCGVPY